MIGDWIFDHSGWILIAVVLLIVGGGCYASVRGLQLEGECLAAGYPEYRVTFNGTYCVKRVDQTDVVVPIEQTRRAR
jgi:hypothetical protein